MSTLSPELMTLIAPYLRPLPLYVHADFLAELGAELANVAEVGPGVIARICRDVQPRYIDQQAVGSGPRSTPAPKYARPNWGIDRSGRLRIRPE